MTSDISVQNLSYAYPPLVQGSDSLPVLRGISFDVARGESVGLLGRVGAGKTTLCMALNGLVPHATGGTFRGDVTVCGLNTKHQGVANLARVIGSVFQDPERQLIQMRVEDEVAFGAENLGVPTQEIEERVTWALDAVGLLPYRDRSPLLLSGGEQQRLAIAAMLAMRPQVLVLDEPMASLDPAGKAAVYKVLADFRRQHDLTIFMATQELERTVRFFDRILVLHDGQIVLEGAPAEVLADVPRLKELGIGVPQLMDLACLLAQRTGKKYSFSSRSEAFQQLRRQARKVKMHARKPRFPAIAAPRPNPFADHTMIAVEQVSHVYPDRTVALQDVNLILHPGDFVALLGANGAGKTTLARHFNGLLRPTTGRVLVEKMDTRLTRVAQLSRLVGYVFQNPDHQIFAPTVEEEIAFGPRVQDLPPAIVAQRVADALDRFRLVPYAQTPPALLGYAQRRQVALAAIIALQPKVLLLDEPTGGLDWRSQQELMEVIAGFNTQGRTVVLITHDMNLVAEYATRAVVLVSGKIVFDDTTRELFRRPSVVAQAQLALPPVTRLARRLRSEGMQPDVLTCAEFAAAWTARLPARSGKRKKGFEEFPWDCDGNARI